MFSAAITDYNRHGNLQAIEVYVTHHSAGLEVQDEGAAPGKGPVTASLYGRRHHMVKSAWNRREMGPNSSFLRMSLLQELPQ